ncbi:MAG: hypothetical protein R3Y53_08760 [Bacillota bacterium]
MDKNQILLVANAGVVLVHNQTRLLIDGIYNDLGQNFTQLPKWAWNTMKAGKGELGNVDYLLFTHSHYDHYYSPYFFEYMEHNTVKGLVLPDLDDTNGLDEAWKLYGDKHIEIPENTKVELEEGLFVSRFVVRHVGEQFHHLPVACFIVEMDGVKSLFISDGDYHIADYEKVAELECDYAFVTSVFFNHKNGRELLWNHIKAKEIVVYHLPSPEDDKFSYCKMAQRDIKKHTKDNAKATLWNETGQRITWN